jgi:glycerophosphoryl diester phosphodiesterase
LTGLAPLTTGYILAHSHSWEPRGGETSHAGLKVIGHRGAAGHAPENTFAAFDLGLEMGCDGVETDLRASSDGVLVLMHDATVDRTTDGIGPVHELTWAEIRALDASAKFKAGQHTFGVQRVPRLDEFLDRYAGRTRYRLEIKQRGVEDAALRAVRARSLMAHAVFTSFSLDSVRAVRRAAPDAQVAYLSSEPTFDDAVIAKALETGANEVAPRAERVTAAAVQRAQAAGLRVWAWGVRDRETLALAIREGIGGSTLDYPEWGLELQRR